MNSLLPIPRDQARSLQTHTRARGNASHSLTRSPRLEVSTHPLRAPADGLRKLSMAEQIKKGARPFHMLPIYKDKGSRVKIAVLPDGLQKAAKAAKAPAKPWRDLATGQLNSRRHVFKTVIDRLIDLLPTDLKALVSKQDLFQFLQLMEQGAYGDEFQAAYLQFENTREFVRSAGLVPVFLVNAINRIHVSKDNIKLSKEADDCVERLSHQLQAHKAQATDVRAVDYFDEVPHSREYERVSKAFRQELRASGWYPSPEKLARDLDQIEHSDFIDRITLGFFWGGLPQLQELAATNPESEQFREKLNALLDSARSILIGFDSEPLKSQSNTVFDMAKYLYIYNDETKQCEEKTADYVVIDNFVKAIQEHAKSIAKPVTFHYPSLTAPVKTAEPAPSVCPPKPRLLNPVPEIQSAHVKEGSGSLYETAESFFSAFSRFSNDEPSIEIAVADAAQASVPPATPSVQAHARLGHVSSVVAPQSAAATSSALKEPSMQDGNVQRRLAAVAICATTVVASPVILAASAAVVLGCAVFGVLNSINTLSFPMPIFKFVDDQGNVKAALYNADNANASLGRGFATLGFFDWLAPKMLKLGEAVEQNLGIASNPHPVPFNAQKPLTKGAFIAGVNEEMEFQRSHGTAEEKAALSTREGQKKALQVIANKHFTQHQTAAAKSATLFAPLALAFVKADVFLHKRFY